MIMKNKLDYYFREIKGLLAMILFGFLIIFNNGERLSMSQANALLIDGKNIIFLEIQVQKVIPLKAFPIEDIRYIIEYYKEST